MWASWMCGTSAGAIARSSCHAADCDRQAAQSARGGKQHSFGQQLAQDAPAAGAERHAHRNFFLPGDGARQQQIRNIDAHDQQHQRDRAREHQQRGPDIAYQAVVQAQNTSLRARSRSAELLGVGGLQSPVHQGQVRRRALGRDSLLQTRNSGIEIGPVAGLGRRFGHRDQQGRGLVLGKLEPAGQDSGDGVQLAIERHPPGEDRGVTAESPHPEGVRDQRDCATARRRVGGRQIASDERRHSEHAQKTRRRELHFQLLRLAVPRDRKLAARIGGESIEDGRLIAPHRILEIRHVEAEEVVFADVDRRDEAAGVPIGQGTQQHGIDDAENRRVGADSESGGQDRHRREAAVMVQHPAAVAEILHEAVQPHAAPRLTGVFADERGVAESAPRGIASLLRRRAIVALFFRFEFQVRAQFAIQVRFPPASIPAHVTPPSPSPSRARWRPPFGPISIPPR